MESDHLLKVPPAVDPQKEGWAGSGLEITYVDTDPQSNALGLLMTGAQLGQDIVAVIPYVFHGRTPGFIVIRYDPKQDPLRKVDGQ